MDLLTIEEVAGLLRVSRHTVYRLALRGDIPGQKVGRHWRFIREDLLQHLRQQSAERMAGAAPADGRDGGQEAAGT